MKALIHIKTREDAAAMLAGPNAVTHLLSFDGGTLGPVSGFDTVPNRLYGEFADVSLPRSWGPYEPPTVDDVKRIIAFGRTVPWGSADTVVLAHCAQGISRSTAAVWTMLADHFGAGNERAALEDVLRVRWCAHPNRLMMQYADVALNRDGALERALDEYRQQSWAGSYVG